jgi:RNA polymerase sigma-70 factor (ECF subfamily)
MNISTDQSLTILAARGDQEAFGELVNHHQSVVFSVAYRMLGNHNDAEDATQETFVRAYYAFDTFDTKRPILPWLKRITVNTCLNRIKQDRPSSSLDDYLPSLKEARPGPEVQTTDHERDVQIHTAILSLPPLFRAVIELRHFQDLSYAEICEVLDRPLSNIKSDLFRARKMLAKKLKDLKNQ